jgi:hypothetical protein
MPRKTSNPRKIKLLAELAVARDAQEKWKVRLKWASTHLEKERRRIRRLETRLRKLDEEGTP